ncbi:Hypothetical Protein FCC1311_098172 [Hondaea fermentalgiana]|uniref:VOC domain-containing protein n=1 Tax=Hondaea fermentalgiana TaxID=2315210 RepID=A0A2R5GZV7_9STRA|nr:Hypothetical Protein FCC1311_098172 [Hondaea fermentalgiana]|eukprot:GBG33594.1 Hypothetical Protein FCC1311_098172 [Hondaea fermentalgiana]
MEVALVSGLGFTFAREQTLGHDGTGDFDEAFLMQLEPAAKVMGLRSASGGFKRRAEAASPLNGRYASGTERKRARVPACEPLALSDALQQLALSPALLDFVMDVLNAGEAALPEGTAFSEGTTHGDMDDDDDDEDDDEEAEVQAFGELSSDGYSEASGDIGDSDSEHDGELVFVHFGETDDHFARLGRCTGDRITFGNPNTNDDDEEESKNHCNKSDDLCDASDAGCSCSSESLRSFPANDFQSPSNFASPRWESINAITFATTDMAASVKFYESLGLELTYGNKSAPFSTLGLGGADNTLHVNLFKVEETFDAKSWGRVIIYVSDVDAMYKQVCAAGYTPEAEPADAVWGERYFQIRDPIGHELSFAKKIPGHKFWKRPKIAPRFDAEAAAQGRRTAVAAAAVVCGFLFWQASRT